MGRPKANIDWAVVDDMLESGCIGTEVAAFLGISNETLYRHVEATFKMGFDAYRQQKVAKGDQILRQKLYKEATGGNTSVLIFLGKVRLGLSEKTEVEHTITKETVQNISIAFRGA